jgi:hypothetical protein
LRLLKQQGSMSHLQSLFQRSDAMHMSMQRLGLDWSKAAVKRSAAVAVGSSE